MPTKDRPSTGWYWAAGALALAGVVGAVIWGAAAYLRLLDRVDAFPRAAIPGSTIVEVSEPGGLTIYYEATDLAERGSPPPIAVTVVGPDGSSVPTAPYRSDLRLEDRGRSLTALATFEAIAAGEHVVTVDGRAPADAAISVGPGLALGVVGNILGIVLLPVVTVLAAALIVVVVAVRRSSRSRTPVRTAPRQPVGT